jgi:hypothetical protein
MAIDQLGDHMVMDYRLSIVLKNQTTKQDNQNFVFLFMNKMLLFVIF